MRIYPPVIAGFYLLAAFVLNYFFPIGRVIYSPYNFVGVLILGGGFALMVWAKQSFEKKGTTINPHGMATALITNGPFVFSRNPMYLGLLLILLGFAVLIGTISLFLAPFALFLTINATSIPREEKRLEKIFGQKYKKYKNRVRRWL